MVATRKRKSTRQAAKSKKTKAEEEAAEDPKEEPLPTEEDAEAAKKDKPVEVEASGKAAEEKEEDAAADDAADDAAKDAEAGGVKNGKNTAENAKDEHAKDENAKDEEAKAEDDPAATEEEKVHPPGGEATAEADTAPPEKKAEPAPALAPAPEAAPAPAPKTSPSPKAAPPPAALPSGVPSGAPAPVAPVAPVVAPAPVAPAPVAPAPVAPAPVAPSPVAPAPVVPAVVAPAPVVPAVVAPAPVAPTELVLEESGSVPALYVGRVIGRGGETVRDLQARSGCRIDVDQVSETPLVQHCVSVCRVVSVHRLGPGSSRAPFGPVFPLRSRDAQNVPRDAPRIITYRGTRAAIDLAKHLVGLLCTEGGDDANLPLGRASRRLVRVPETAVGKIIGRAGEMIRKMQSESQASIQVDHTGGGAEAGRRLVTITGTPDSVAKAEEMVLFLAANPAVDALQALNMLTRDKTQGGGVWGSGPPYPNLPNQGQGMPDQGAAAEGYPGGGYGAPSTGYGGTYGGGTYGPAGGDAGGGMGPGSDVFPCSKTHVGRVIGQKGVTINDIQKRSGCDIQINQNVPQGQDCQITLRGSREGIEMAKRMLQDIIELGSNHPYAGGREFLG